MDTRGIAVLKHDLSYDLGSGTRVQCGRNSSMILWAKARTVQSIVVQHVMCHLQKLLQCILSLCRTWCAISKSMKVLSFLVQHMKCFFWRELPNLWEYGGGCQKHKTNLITFRFEIPQPAHQRGAPCMNQSFVQKLSKSCPKQFSSNFNSLVRKNRSTFFQKLLKHRSKVIQTLPKHRSKVAQKLAKSSKISPTVANQSNNIYICSNAMAK